MVPVGPSGVIFRNERIIQAAGHLHHGAAAGTAPEDGDAPLPADTGFDLAGDCIGVTHHHKGLARFPERERFNAFAGFAPVQQGFVGGQIFGGGREGEIEEVHAGRAVGREETGERHRRGSEVGPRNPPSPRLWRTRAEEDRRTPGRFARSYRPMHKRGCRNGLRCQLLKRIRRSGSLAENLAGILGADCV